MTSWLDCHDMAKVLNVSHRTVQRWAAASAIPHVRIGRAIRFTHDQVDEIAAAYTVRPPVIIDVDQPNPDYRPSRAVVVPMKRT